MNNNIFTSLLYVCAVSLSSCTYRKFYKYLKDNVRYISYKDCWYVDCFVISNDMIINDTCSASFGVSQLNSFPGYYGRNRSFSNKDSNLYDKYHVKTPLRGPTPRQNICFRFDGFDSLTSIPSTFDIKVTFNQELSFRAIDYNILFWIPNCDVEAYNQFKNIDFKIEYYLWDGYNPNDEWGNQSFWTGETLLVEKKQYYITTIFNDEPIAEQRI